MSYHRQPSLDDLVSVLWAPSVCLSAPDGQVRPGELDGFYRGDVRLLSRLTAEVGGAAVKPVGRQVSAAEAVFAAYVRPDGDDASDVSLLWYRRRTAGPDAVNEQLEFSSFAPGATQVTVTVRAEADLAAVHEVRGGTHPPVLTPSLTADGAAWAGAGHMVDLTCDPLPHQVTLDGATVVLTFHLEVTARQPAVVTLWVLGTETPGDAAERVFLPLPAGQPPVLAPGSQPADPRRRRLLETSLADVERMILADPADPRDQFVSAGSPWYFTLFGRDALWSASLLLPHSRTLAAGTLRALQRRQGNRIVPGSEEEPGKILHEVRRETLRLGEMVIPPVYYGTIDATALWIRLLHEAWRAGMPEAEVAALLPGLQAALDWITTYGDADGDGFVEYRASTRGGLANQGWKDTPGAVRWADGREAQAPLALCEVQGYAYAAVMHGADMLDAFGQHGVPLRRQWAADLQDRFRHSFWLTDESGTYPAIALDRDKKPVDGAASNMAHLLGTGLLAPHEAAQVAARLAAPDLNCGYGLRTLSSASKAFNPLSYHCGSVWPHDTAIAVLGLAAEGYHDIAHTLAEGLVTAAEQFDWRLPELYAGTSAHHGEPVLAYPTACRPQAWAAAGAVAVIGYLESSGTTREIAASSPVPGQRTLQHLRPN
ncbi:glycogen debranching N-terminal domain-containing protein [Acrocarpospora catenulata]|uniref:glycogen debranching N-terminal domain-containing protein n=1 Tax=Acrocarpospora catenulata TaxID=2836182 RepID=UPI001BDAFE38|nr:glycogen debranching N-terminal domain-containing protein [Acrocarpospora catenulata]